MWKCCYGKWAAQNINLLPLKRKTAGPCRWWDSWRVEFWLSSPPTELSLWVRLAIQDCVSVALCSNTMTWIEVFLHSLELPAFFPSLQKLNSPGSPQMGNEVRNCCPGRKRRCRVPPGSVNAVETGWTRGPGEGLTWQLRKRIGSEVATPGV